MTIGLCALKDLRKGTKLQSFFSCKVEGIVKRNKMSVEQHLIMYLV